ncbi:Acylamidase [Pigmentiphaga humi]|uniref:Acylamidase n=1 Tax=Pigmentiphaga humi TaxID=2478468 RepID=A0A3P4AYN6_9BURK|nr:amidase family protein [Pigmentiphaga humi]VCU68476.1 Acylamidase [Pigmentiphaga humi]
MPDSSFLTLPGVRDLYARKALSPVELLDAQLARIDALDPQINAFTVRDTERARQAARDSEARWMRGEALGPLDGMPFVAKDNLMVAGLPHRRGSRAMPDTPMTETAPAVLRCQEAGAVLLGLTTMPELGAGPVTISPLTGITRNPWDTSKQAGGSSGGSAASVAAGFCPFALGTDAGGSLRIPAALTGVVGFKPTGALVPMYPPNVAGGLSCVGPLARGVRDAVTVLDVIMQRDARDAMALPWRPDGFTDGLDQGMAGRRIAMSLTLGYAPQVDPEIERAFRRVAELLTGMGAVVEEADPDIANPIDDYLVLLQSGYRYALQNLPAERRALLSPGMTEILEDARGVTLEAYMAAQARCQDLARRLLDFHQRFDLLLTPTVAAPAFAADRSYPEAFEAYPNRRAWTPYTSLFNLTQQPAISLPMGLSEAGLPLGLHIAAPRGHDALVLQAACALEAQLGFTARPSVAAR